MANSITTNGLINSTTFFNNTTNIIDTQKSQDFTYVTGYIVTGVVCGVLLIILISFLVAVLVHYRLIRKSPRYTVDMGQCVKYNSPNNKPQKFDGNNNSNNNKNTKTSNSSNNDNKYSQVNKNFMPNDLLNIAHNPNYSEMNIDNTSNRNSDSNISLPPYSFVNPNYMEHDSSKGISNEHLNTPSLQSDDYQPYSKKIDDPNAEITSL